VLFTFHTTPVQHQADYIVAYLLHGQAFLADDINLVSDIMHHSTHTHCSIGGRSFGAAGPLV